MFLCNGFSKYKKSASDAQDRGLVKAQTCDSSEKHVDFPVECYAAKCYLKLFYFSREDYFVCFSFNVDGRRGRKKGVDNMPKDTTNEYMGRIQFAGKD
jgi:hypothetical protein